MEAQTSGGGGGAGGRGESVPEVLPELKDLENKVGRKTPDGLLRWLWEDHTARPTAAEDNVDKLGEAGGGDQQGLLAPRGGGGGGEGGGERLPQAQGLAEKIRILSEVAYCDVQQPKLLEGSLRSNLSVYHPLVVMAQKAYLRAIDIKIMHQLMAVNEGIEAVKWILEEKGTLASRCSSLTSSMYSLVESQETSRRGSWNSLQDPNDKLDGISIGSFLDTLADDMDEYCQTPVEPGSSLPSAQGREGREDLSPFCPADKEKHAGESRCQPPAAKANGFVGKPGNGPAAEAQCPREDKPGREPAAKLKLQRNGKVDYEGRKLNTVHIEYDAHWRWVQSQDDVTFL